MTILSRVCVVAILHDQKKLVITRRAVVASKRASQSFHTWRLLRQHQRRANKALPTKPALGVVAAIPLYSARRRRSRQALRSCSNSNNNNSSPGYEQQQQQRHRRGSSSEATCFSLTGVNMDLLADNDHRRPAYRRYSAAERDPPEQDTQYFNIGAFGTPTTWTTPVTARPYVPDQQKLSFAQRINGSDWSPQGSRSVRGSMSLDLGSTSSGNTMPPPPAPIAAATIAPPSTPGLVDDVVATRSSRSTSSASRNLNRLSISLPIAVPTCDPTRPAPASAVSTVPPSFPGTPSESCMSASTSYSSYNSHHASPTESNQFIIAIAAQERRVLELREELQRAEADLKSLHKQFAVHEGGGGGKGSGRAGDRRHHHAAELPRPGRLETSTTAGPVGGSTTPGGVSDTDDVPLRQSLDLDRRRQILQSHQNTPREGSGGNRRVFTGKHTRALSLLSPAKTDGGNDFSVLEDKDICKSPTGENGKPRHHGNGHRGGGPSQAALTKRMTWQPRTTQQQPAGQAAMSQIVEDFKTSFRSFYEDIRQITVGDEPVGGPETRSTGIDLYGGGRSGGGNRRSYAEDQETIRPAQSATRPRVITAFDSPSVLETPTKPRPSSNANTAGAGGVGAARTDRERAEIRARKPKHFSWTPLSFEAIDGDAWMSFDSPSSSGKPARWSGSTINDADGDTTQQSPAEAGRENDTSLKMKGSPLGLPSTASFSPQKLEELTSQVVNRLSPNNIRRTANDLFKDWERSLTDPAEVKTMTASPAAATVRSTPDVDDDKENATV